MSQSPHPPVTLMLANTPSAVGLARLHTVDVLSRWGVPSDTIETVRLLVSELTANAVRHPKEKGGEGASLFSPQFDVQCFELALEAVRDAVRVSVWDRDERPPVLKRPGVEATSGRGILIVAEMSSRWGYYPARGVPGKVVWAEAALGPVSRAGEGESTGRHPSTGRGLPRPDPHLLGRVLIGVRDL